MRCLALAGALNEQGHETVFVCRQLPGSLIGFIGENGYHVLALPPTARRIPVAAGEPPHAAWLLADPNDDANETYAALVGFGRADLLVVDHYAIDRRWEARLRAAVRTIVAIDDLADRQHDCDWLVDQNIGAEREVRYDGRVRGTTALLLGPRFALLGKRFAELREASLGRRRADPALQLLVTMGGVDKTNATGAVLDALRDIEALGDAEATIVLGRTAPWVEDVQRRAANLPFSARVAVGVSNMAEIMANSDLCIGAAGTSVLERACLGLPSILVALAENQRTFLGDIAATGGALVLDDVDEIRQRLPGLLADLRRDGGVRLRAMSSAAAGLCDGLGARRVVAAITKGAV